MAVTRLFFKIPDAPSETSFTIDLAHALSLFHRRLHRQKQVYTVYGGIYQDSDNSQLEISTAPHYWVTKRSINRGFKAWKKQLHDTMSAVNEVSTTTSLATGKWSDFKVHLDGGAIANYLLPVDAAGQAYPSGEWNYSTVTRPRDDVDVQGDGSIYAAGPSDQFDLKICGEHSTSATDNYSRVSLIKSWLDSRPIPNHNSDNPDDNTNTPSDPITQMFLTGDADEDDKILDNINQENDIAPYDYDKLLGAAGTSGAGAELQMQCIISTANSGNGNSSTQSVPGFQALCGLVRLVVSGDNNGSSYLILDVESKGVGF